jgi:hypothetical protein
VAKHLFKPGDKRPEGAGRKAGTPNKKTLEFQEILARNNFDPGQALVEIYQEQMKLFELMRKNRPYALTPASVLLEKAQTTVNNICQYVYPRKKAIEHTGEVGVKTFADFIAASVKPK